MNISIKSNGSGLEFHVIVHWQSLQATLEAIRRIATVVLPFITAILSLVAAPEIKRLGTLLGWW